jgi:RNA 2',3'-cyclic 3'-phosphodiesterase
LWPPNADSETRHQAGTRPAPTDMAETKKRLFVAIALPDEILKNLEEVQKKLKRFGRDAKWVKPQSIHLTLKFLGYVDPAKIPEIKESLLTSSSKFSAVPVVLKGCGFFPNSRRPSVLWAGVDSKGLLPIQEFLEDLLVPLGFEKEGRPFSPHLTLARFRDPHGWMHLVDEAGKFQEEVFGEFIASSLILFESILHRDGAEYIRHAEFHFAS